MCSGKTTIGKLLAKELNCDHLDTDLEIEKKFKISINDLFLHRGERFFRNEEFKILKKIKNTKKQLIVSAGGGIFTSKKCKKIIQQIGTSVYLQNKFNILYKRLLNENQNRPIFKCNTKVELEKLYEVRKHDYEKADLKINCNKKTKCQILVEINSLIFF